MDSRLTLNEWHRKQAVDNFNQTWDLIDRAARSPEENLAMIHKAHASRYHWGEVGGLHEMATGEWQISRVYALLGMGESSLFHARAGLSYCERGSLSPFDIAIAHEALARASHVLGARGQRDEALAAARSFAATIEKDEDRRYALAEIDSIMKDS